MSRKKAIHHAVNSEAAASYHAHSEGEGGVPPSPSLSKREEDTRIAQALQILEKRYYAKSMNCMDAPTTVKAFLRLRYAQRDREVFGLLLLDNKHNLLEVVELFEGTIDGASVYPREVVKACLNSGSVAVMIFHNHPSGDPEPSPADQGLTQRLKTALSTVDIRLLDHFIVGSSGTISFAERGFL